MEFSDDTPLLQDIYRGTEMALGAISVLLPKVKNAAFRSEMNTMYQDYSALSREAEQALAREGQCPHALESWEKCLFKAVLHARTLCNQETSHLARLLIQGSNMGILSLTGILNTMREQPAAQTEQQRSSAAEATAMAQRMLHKEQQHIDRLKTFLR